MIDPFIALRPLLIGQASVASGFIKPINRGERVTHDASDRLVSIGQEEFGAPFWTDIFSLSCFFTAGGIVFHHSPKLDLRLDDTCEGCGIVCSYVAERFVIDIFLASDGFGE